MSLREAVFFLDEFAVRQWDDASYSGTRISHDKDDFLQRVHDFHAKVLKGNHDAETGRHRFTYSAIVCNRNINTGKFSTLPECLSVCLLVVAGC
jgi:hypothetical protein